MESALIRQALTSFCSMALLIGGCPRRQTTPRVVYVPASPPEAAPAPSEKSEKPETLVIEEPPPTEPQSEATPAEPPPPRPARPRRRRLTPPEPLVEPAPAPPDAPPATAEVPALAPGESPEQGVALREQTLALQQSVEQRIAQLSHMRLTAADGKTLEDARTFLAQSRRALDDGDLQRSLTLARKAALLVDALEKQP